MYAGVDKYGGALVGEGQPDGETRAETSGLSLEETIETAAAEETVVVDVPYSYYEDEDDESSLVTGTSQVLLAAQLNPEAGGLMWVEHESAQAAYKNVVAMSQMTSMLRDLDRNRCYELGIKSAIARFTERHKRAPIVLDIGTGTGLLSMFAAAHGAEHVYACEMFKPMADIAQQVTATNHPDKITVYALRSTDLIVKTDAKSEEEAAKSHLPRRADMLVSELFDSILLGEAVIPIVRHAMQHLLVSEPMIIPERATVFAQVVQNEQIYRMNSLHGQHLNGMQARLARSDAAWECTGANPALPLHISAVAATNTELTAVTPVLSFDFTKPIPSTTNNSETSSVLSYQETVVSAIASGQVHAVVMWWTVSFDEADIIVYSTQPQAQNWQDHWVQVVFPLASRLEVQPADALVLRAHHDDLRIWFDVEKQEKDDSLASSPLKKSKTSSPSRVQTEKQPCTCGLHLVCNAERIAMLADSQRTGAFNAAIAKAVSILKQQRDGKELACLDISDGSLCALLAASNGVHHVTSVESKDVSARIFQQILDGNAHAMADTEADVDVLCCGCKGLLPEHIRGEQPADLLVGEPFYYSMQNLPLWQAFNFWLRRTAVADTLKPDAIIVPAKARVCALAVQFEHLHECFGAVGDVSGFDHSYFDQFQDEYYARNFPFPTYMYPYTAVSDVLTLGAWDYSDLAHSVVSDFTTELPAGANGEVKRPNGVIVWVEYSLDRDGEHVVATGPSAVHSKQLVRFLPTAAASGESEAHSTKALLLLQSRFHFNALEGTIDVDFSFAE